MTPDAGPDTTRRVARLLDPAGVAIVGASDRSRWSSTLYANLRDGGFQGPVALVNPKGGRVHGARAVESCAALSQPVDLGVVLVPHAAVPEVIEDLADAGAAAAMVLTSGFAETGADGAARQDALVARARRRGMTLLGPNSLGFINYTVGVRAWATAIAPPSRRDGVAIVSQSGATALFLSQLAQDQDIGLSHVIATGNEADLDVTAFLDHLLDQPETRAVAAFVETVRDPARFLLCAEKALAAGKPLVLLKVGRSEVTARSAEAHTGALVGDDRVFDGLCRQYGIIRVNSVEDLLVTADIAARTGVLRPGGLAVLSNSGGICEIAADRAQEAGLSLPPLSQVTLSALQKMLPDYGTPHNPLDLTGGIDPEQCEAIVGLLGGQDDVAAVLCPYYPVPAAPDQVSDRLTALHGGLSRGLNGLDVPGLLVSYTNTVVTDFARDIVARDDLPYHACGLDRAIAAIRGIAGWSERQRIGRPALSATQANSSSSRPRSEAEALQYLAAWGVPVLPARRVATADQAAEAADAAGGAVAIKIDSPDIPHKSDIGGVALNIGGADAARAAFDGVIGAAATHCPQARIEGAIVAPMREGGVELFVGCHRDRQWGPVLALGLGGIWVETLKDVALRLLPVDTAEVRRMLDELRGAALLQATRGHPAADLDTVAAAVVAIGDAALAAGRDLTVLEINPLWVRGDAVEALDALVEWAPRSPE